MTILWLAIVLPLVALWLIGQLRLALMVVLDWCLRKHPLTTRPEATSWPPVTVQLAVYREQLVLGSVLDAIFAMDYPSDRLQVHVLDDSTGDDAARTRRVVDDFARKGCGVAYFNRQSRHGYKAGALNYGLAIAETDLI